MTVPDLPFLTSEQTMLSPFRAAIVAAALAVASPAFAQHGVVHLGDLDISLPFTRATLPNAPVGGGFMTITNNGAEDDRLVSASSDAAAEVQLHEMAMDGDVMKMRRLADGIVIPAGETVELKPGGLHVMFIGLAAPFVEGETVTVTLSFEKAGSIEVGLPVGGAAAAAADGEHGGHH